MAQGNIILLSLNKYQPHSQLGSPFTIISHSQAFLHTTNYGINLICAILYFYIMSIYTMELSLPSWLWYCCAEPVCHSEMQIFAISQTQLLSPK